MTLFSLFTDAARKAGDRPAIRLRNSAVSYSELYDRVLRYAAQLQAQAEIPGGIAIILRDRVELLSAFLACVAIGRPAAPIDPDLPSARLKAVLTARGNGDGSRTDRASRSTLTRNAAHSALSPQGRGHGAEFTASLPSPLRGEGGAKRRMRVSSAELDGLDDNLPNHFSGVLRDRGVHFEASKGIAEFQLSDKYAPSEPTVSNDPQAEFYWGLTSGTTGEPKLVARSHASWIASFEAAEAVFDFRAGDTVLVPGPLHHSLFLYGAAHALCRGHCLALPPAQFRADRLPAFGASHLYAVPFMLGKLASERRRIPGLRQIFCGGAKLTPTLRNTCEALWPDVDLIEFYGSTETSFVSFHSTKNPGPENSVGRIFPGVRIEIRNTNGDSAAPTGDGEIFVASDMLFDRYVGGERASQWVSVGDIGRLDAQNCLHLTGRKNRIINSKGLKIHPEQIEAALATLPEIEAAAVIGVPDNLRGAAAVAIITFTPGRRTGRAMLSAFCRAAFGEGYSPLRFYESDSLPKSSNGKLALSAIAEAMAKGDPAYRELT